MTVTISGTSGISGADGSASTPAFQGTDTNTGIYFPGADRIGFTEGGVQVGEFDASANFKFNSGYGSVATAYGCRAWVNFNGTGTVAIRASGNVTSITDNGTGDYTINFTTAMPDANYAWAGSAKAMAAVNAWVVGDPVNGNAPTTSALRFKVSQGNFANYDADYVTMTVFR